MKKVTLAIAMAALVLFAGCKKEKETNGVVLKASIEQNKGNDRTSLNPTDGAINWTAGDKILVNNGTSNNAIFTLTGGAGTTEGTFVYNGDYEFGANNVAVYPHTATINGNTITFDLPDEQNLTAPGSFADDANPMMSTFSDPNSLSFTSLCGGLGIGLKGNTPITGIEIVSNTTTDKLNGAFEADAANPVLTPAVGNSGTNSIMLNCDATLTADAQEFYIVLPVGTLAQGFTLNVYNGGATPILTQTTHSDQLVVVLNTVKKMNTLEVTGGGGGDEHEYVDLGLPSGLLWATCNVGADNPEDYGDYFAWGETTTKSTYNWSTYQYCNGSEDKLTKYCNDASYGYNGFTDDLTTLQPGDDAATANWGGNWRMPTKADFEELLDNTTNTWTQQGGVNGWLFTAANSNSLFLPAAGARSNGELHEAGDWGFYWSSSLDTDGPYCAWNFVFMSSGCGMGFDGYRVFGFTVRPVREN